MNNLALDSIMKRRSIRDYKDIPLTKEEKTALVQAALISPSSMNRQPWHLSVVENQGLLLELEKEIVDYFKENGPESVSKRIEERKNKVLYNAPALFLISVADAEGLMDVGIMAQSINIAAKSMGLSSVILGLPRVAFLGATGEAWKTRLQFPPGYIYGIAVAVGQGKAPGVPREADLEKVSFVE